MRGALPPFRVAGCRRVARRSVGSSLDRRHIQISATPTAESPNIDVDAISGSIDSSVNAADARFEVLGAPYSLLSVSLSASQKLYTRRGTLVGLSGKAENAQSTLSVLSPFLRAPLGIPFLYHRITSTTPTTLLLSTKSPITSISILHLSGTTDWMLTQRRALLAWTGHTLQLRPTANTRLSLAHWGNTHITGRGLVALAGPGQVYQVTVQKGEEFVAHPGNVVAYRVTANPPLPYRFSSSRLRFQVPDLKGAFGYLVPETKFFRVMRESAWWRFITNSMYSLRTAARRSIWGDRLFLQFKGPCTILMSSRAARVNDVLTSRDVNEIADSPAGEVHKAVTLATMTPEEREAMAREKEMEGNGTGTATSSAADVPTAFHVATVGKDRKVKFEEVDSTAVKK